MTKAMVAAVVLVALSGCGKDSQAADVLTPERCERSELDAAVREALAQDGVKLATNAVRVTTVTFRNADSAITVHAKVGLDQRKTVEFQCRAGNYEVVDVIEAH